MVDPAKIKELKDLTAQIKVEEERVIPLLEPLQKNHENFNSLKAPIEADLRANEIEMDKHKDVLHKMRLKSAELQREIREQAEAK